MPTVSWIIEKDVERFWEGQPVRASDRARPSFDCSLCEKEFSSLEELRSHYSLEHPLALPTLYVCGVPLLRESVIRLALPESDVDLVQCSRCEVQSDGGLWRQWTVSDFRRRFIQETNSTWKVRLFNERSLDQARTKGEYDIRFRIPDDDSLSEVDEHFVHFLALEELRHSDLKRFEAVLPQEAPAREYGSALGDYALGIMLKEGLDTPYAPIGFEEFAIKMRAALEVLRLFNRPVALAVSGGIRFNLNDFRDYGIPTAADLEVALEFFRRMAYQPTAGNSIRTSVSKARNILKHAVCPVDHVSFRLLAACARLARGDALSISELESLGQMIRGAALVSNQDILKINVICAEGYSRLGHSSDALQHIREVQFDPTFKNWAQRRLEDISKNGH
jgi:hypothetical protein